MFGRAAIVLLGLVLLAALPAAGVLAEERDQTVLKRDEDYSELVAMDDDDDGDSNSGYTSGVNSNDGTGSGHTAVSRDGERSRGDKTRDWTRDGAGSRHRDWSGHKTNDRSRNDTR
jgi:hypothetical protein